MSSIVSGCTTRKNDAGKIVNYNLKFEASFTIDLSTICFRSILYIQRYEMQSSS